MIVVAWSIAGARRKPIPVIILVALMMLLILVVKDNVHWTFLQILASIVCLGDSDDEDDSDAGDLDNTKLMVLIVMCLMVFTRIILVVDEMDSVHSLI